MTLQEAKEKVANKYGYQQWINISFYEIDERDEITSPPYAKERLVDEVAELYARSKQIESEQIYISTDRPHNVYCAFTDEERAKIDTEDSGVTYTSVTLHRGPKPEFK